MNFFRLFGIGLVTLLLLNGCGGNNSDTPTSTDIGTSVPIGYDSNTTPSVTVILFKKATTLTTNSQVVTIDVRAYDELNNPYSEGNITVINSPDVLLPRDVGTFDSYSKALVNGVASFTYTGPKVLNENTKSLKFGFFHSDYPSNIQYYTMSIVPEVNQTILTSYIIKSSISDDVTMGLKSTKTIGYSIYDTSGNELDDAKIISLSVTTSNPNLGLLSDSAGNDNVTQITSDKNNLTVNVNSNTQSGLLPIQVNATFLDDNGDEQNLSTTFSIVIFSGPPTAISMTYNGTSYTKDGLYQEKYTILVTDKYQNRVNTNPSLSLSMITGYANDATDGARLFSAPSIPAIAGAFPGTMDPINNIFEVDGRDFSNVDTNNDFLLTYGNGYTYNASGKWDIDTNGVASNQLQLLDNFDGDKTVDNIGFVVGHNYRQDTCKPGEESVAQIYINGANQIDNDGIARIKIDYPYYLGGKTVFIGAATIGDTMDGNITSKFSEVKKITLRTTGFKDYVADISAGAKSVTVYLPVALKDAAEWYRNANIGGRIITSDNISINSKNVSFYGQLNSCFSPPPGTDYGTAYVKITDVNETDGKAGTITLTDIVVADEF
ncbi:hypothetical protein [Sulfurimonas sp.]